MTMKNIVKKIGMMLLTMVIVSFFAFLAFQIIPGDLTTKLLGSDATAEAVAAILTAAKDFDLSGAGCLADSLHDCLLRDPASKA